MKAIRHERWGNIEINSKDKGITGKKAKVAAIASSFTAAVAHTAADYSHHSITRFLSPPLHVNPVLFLDFSVAPLSMEVNRVFIFANLVRVKFCLLRSLTPTIC